MAFDFPRWLRQEGIEYVDAGKNVAKDNIGIRCPFCGDNDPSEHMGISARTGAWNCWRDPTHRGRKPERLIRALKHCSWQEAAAIAQSESVIDASPLSSLKQRAALLFEPRTEQALEVLDLPDELRPLTANTPMFGRYLVHRGFEPRDVPKLAKRYALRYAVRGPFKQRLVFPIFHDGDLIGWTGRAIGRSRIPYLSHPTGSAIKRVVYNGDKAERGGKVLVVVEGPIDAIKLDWYGHQSAGVCAVATLGAVYSAAQTASLVRLAKFFRRTAVLFDRDATRLAHRLASELAVVGAVVATMPPDGPSDPGGLSPEQARELGRRLSTGRDNPSRLW